MWTLRWFGRLLLLVASVTILGRRWLDRTASVRRTTLKRSRARTRVGLLAVAGVMWMAGPAAAGPLVDPDTLQPPPPPGSECRLDGAWIICHTSLVFAPVNEPILDFRLPCGTLYETASDVRRGIRWYDSSTGRLVTRFVTQDFEGTWSLSPTGAGPTVRVTAHANWRNVNIDADADESTWPTTFHGNGFTIQAPGFGVIVHIAGLDLPDGTHRGVARVIEDPEVAAELCGALTR
jgi:hypothetical protein